MSRCFPFPPPGYEKKARADDVDLLKKEKHKEKKHKKEKRDKGKTEDKDRKGKDKSDGKYRDKKDRKDKSKEKKKDKEREKGDKTSTSQEKKIHAQVESCHGGHKLVHKEREQVKDQSITSNENKKSTPFRAHIGENPMEKSLYDDMDKFVLDLCSRIKDEEKGSASQSTEKSPFTGQTNHEMVKNRNGIIPEGKEKKKDKRVDIRKINGQGLSVGATVGVHTIVHNIVGKEKNENKVVDIGRRVQNRAEEVSKIFEKSLEPRDKNHKQVSVGATISVSTMVHNIAGKERNENKGDSIGDWFQNKAEEIQSILEKCSETRDKNHRKESEDKRGSKRKDKHKEKKSHGKDKEREKEKKKEEKAKRKSEQKIKGHDRVKDSIKNGHLISQIKKMPPLVPNGDMNLIHGQSTKIPPFVPDGDKNLIPGQNTKLPHFVPDGDKNLITGHITKLLPLVADGDRNLILGQNTKLSHFVPNGDRNLILGQMRKLPPSVPGGDRNLLLEQNTKLPPSVLDCNRTPAIEGNIKKRKDIVANGFLHETNVVPNKKVRPIHSSIQNGRKLEPCQTPVLHTPEKKAPPPNNLIKMHNNEHKVNGKIEIQPLSICSKRPSSSLSSSPTLKTKADEMVVAPKVKPPHPDTKYLSEVFLVPKIEEWCDFGEEEWLFSRKGLVSVSSGPTKASETARVWAEAVQIESADVCALPYVIPY